MYRTVFTNLLIDNRLDKHSLNTKGCGANALQMYIVHGLVCMT